VSRFSELCARGADALGLPRSWGQIYALLYMSPNPLGLEEITHQLSLSKGAVSMTVRQLAQFGLVRRVWQQGDRRDYYEAVEDFRSILRKFLNTTIKPKLENAADVLDQIERELITENKNDPSLHFRRSRIRKLKSLRKKILSLLPLAEDLLK